MRCSALLTLFVPLVAQAAGPMAYTKAVTDIRELYLYPDRVDASVLLLKAAEGVAEDVDWLLVDGGDGAVHLRHGNGTPIGSVSVASMDTLPAALETLEELVVRSGFDVGDVDVRLRVLEGMTNALDRYSRVLAGDRLDRFEVRLKGTLVGIGVRFRLVDDLPVITEVPEGPARRAGLRPDDIIVRVDGVSTLNMRTDDVSRRIRGEEGTEVVLGIQRDGVEFDVRITRAEVPVPNVDHAVLADQVGYVHIDHFSQRTVEHLRASLAALREAGALDRGLVVDLRGNTGGSMKEAARSADQFLTEGLLLRTVGRDGHEVDNLQGEMFAVDAGDEPPIPLVVLMDRQTASGSEILAGALLAHHRAGLVGTRSYGKGTVQKIYRLDEDTRLKLTVAQFLLADDLSVADRGISPDIAVGDVILDSTGARYRGWNEADSGVPWEAVVPAVQERAGWRGQAGEARDVALELARRAVLRSEGWEREPVVAALHAVADEMRAEEEERLAEAYAGREIDWTPADADAGEPAATVRVTARPNPDREDGYIVEATVDNHGETPLHRVLVELSCDSFGYWDGLVIPVGLVPPGASGTGRISLGMRPGIHPREDVVDVSLRAHRRPVATMTPAVFAARSSQVPQVAVESALVGEGPEHRARVSLTNLSDAPLSSVEVYFAAPGDAAIDLVDHAAEVARIDPGATVDVDLGLVVQEGAPQVLPLRLMVEAARYRRLVSWDAPLPRTGEAVALRGPTLSLPSHDVVAPTGRYPLVVVAADETAIDHVVVYRDGRKIGWADGGTPNVHVTIDVELDPGVNEFVAIAQDNDGLRERLAFAVRGEPTAAVDATPE